MVQNGCREIGGGGGGFTLHRIGTIGGLLWMRWWTFAFWRHGVSYLVIAVYGYSFRIDSWHCEDPTKSDYSSQSSKRAKGQHSLQCCRCYLQGTLVFVSVHVTFPRWKANRLRVKAHLINSDLFHSTIQVTTATANTKQQMKFFCFCFQDRHVQINFT
jgi:hypothetical protein